MKELGKVQDVFFGIEDHGILTISIRLDFGGSEQSFGNIGLCYNDRENNRWLDEDGAGMTFIYRILEFFGVTEFPKIEGKTVYALKKDYFSMIDGLERTKFEGGKRFLLDDWKKQFWPDKYK